MAIEYWFLYRISSVVHFLGIVRSYQSLLLVLLVLAADFCHVLGESQYVLFLGVEQSSLVPVSPPGADQPAVFKTSVARLSASLC